MERSDLEKGDPYCSNCGYVLTGATESSKCPECGLPLVEVLMRPVFAPGGKRYRSKARIFGLPVIDIAIGPSGDEKTGRPRGFIAIGDVATGVLAIGGTARGVIAIGGFAMGGFSLGGMSIGLFTSLGGMSIGGIAFGGMAVGGMVRGGGAIGGVADGGMAVGWFARGGGPLGPHRIGPNVTSAQAQDVFDKLGWFFGPWPPTAMSFVSTALVVLVVTLALAGIVGLLAARALARHSGTEAA